MQRQSPAHFLSLVLLLASFALHGCKSTPNPYETPPPTRAILTITHHVGGTHYRTIIYDGAWYQTFANKLLIFDDRAVVRSTESSIIDTIDLAEFGTRGPAVDMKLLDKSLFIVLERDEVIELSLADPWSPREVRRLTHQQLGVRPTRVSIVDNQLYISGQGGIVKLLKPTAIAAEAEKKKEDPKLMLGVQAVVRSPEQFGPVARTAKGLVTTLGRRIVSVPDLQYLGSANEVITLPEALGGPNRVLYRWEGNEGSVVGLMGPDLRELGRMGFVEPVHQVKVVGDTIWIVSSAAVIACTIEGDALVQKHRVAVYGARDVGVLSDNYLAIAGTFGRAVYRLAEDRYGKGDIFIGVHREPSSLELSTYDGRFVLAGSREGFWLYEIERGVKMAERTTLQPLDPRRTVRTLKGNAKLDEAGKFVTVESDSNSFVYEAPPGITFNCLEAVDGDVWIGHDAGITILKGDATTATIVDSKTIPGPINTLYQLRVGGGVTYVSTYGGFGVVRWILEQLPYEKK